MKQKYQILIVLAIVIFYLLSISFAFATEDFNAKTISYKVILQNNFRIPSEDAIIWTGLSEQETYEIRKWLSLPFEEQRDIYSQIGEFWDSNEALPMPVFDKEIVKGMLAYYENSRLKKYRDQLTEAGCADPVWNLYTAIRLRAWDEGDYVAGFGNLDRFQNYISRDEIVRIGVEQDTTNMIMNNQGKPGIQLVNCIGNNGRIGEAFYKAVSFFQENGAVNFVDILNQNGFYLFCPVDTGRNTFTGTFNSFGVIYTTYTKAKLYETPDNVLTNLIKMLLYRESGGISYLRIAFNLTQGPYSYLAETLKEFISSEAFSSLYEKTGVEWYRFAAEGYLGNCKTEASRFSKTLDDLKFVESVRFLKYYDIILPLVGDSWQIEVNEDN